MNLDGIVKFFAPKGMHISDSVRATASEQLTVTDVMAALGMTQADAGIGLAMFLGKAGVSTQDKEAAIRWLAEYAKERVPLAIRRAAGKKLPLCMLQLAKYAYNDYASSAADSVDCPKCAGKGLLEKVESVTRRKFKPLVPELAGMMQEFGQAPMKVEVIRTSQETNQCLCPKCGGKGKISKRCQCGGTGKTMDRKATEFQGVPVYKECARCEGRGYSRPKSSVAYRGVLALLPGLPDRTWRYSWKPFYESLVTRCFQEESYTDVQLRRVTGMQGLSDIA